MVLFSNRVALSAVVAARLVLGLAAGATSVVEATSEVAGASAEVAGAAVSPFSAVVGLAVSTVTACSEAGVVSRIVLGSD